MQVSKALAARPGRLPSDIAIKIAPAGSQCPTHPVVLQWTGSWTAMLFIEHFEYTRDVATMARLTYPLLEGLLDYWSCYLTKVTDTTFPDGYRYDDLNDRCRRPESPRCSSSLGFCGLMTESWVFSDAEPPPGGTNPSPAISFIRRIASALLSMAAVRGLPAHPFAADVLSHLAVLPTFTNASSNVTTWLFFEKAAVVTADSASWPM